MIVSVEATAGTKEWSYTIGLVHGWPPLSRLM
jgi:hypothetical protein